MHTPAGEPRSRTGRGTSASGSSLALVATMVLAGCSGALAATPPHSPSLSPSPGAAWAMIEVIDGDTIRVTNGGTEEVVRLVGINTPEHDECWSEEATAALAEVLDSGPIRMERDVSDRDQFGRLLRYVIAPGGEDAGGWLIDRGHAIARAYPPDTSRDADYRERQLRARGAGLGLWARDACGAALASLDPTTIHLEVHPDAAGDDSLNLNDEWVRITNQGDRPLDLEGWTLRDESSSHRYRFGPLVLATGGNVYVRSGCGTDSEVERYWCVSGSAVWNNGGDTVFLLDPAGNVVTQLGYP